MFQVIHMKNQALFPQKKGKHIIRKMIPIIRPEKINYKILILTGHLKSDQSKI